MKLELLGDESLSLSLDALARDLDEPSDILEDVGEMFRREARRIAPKRSGRMGGSITLGRRGPSVTATAVAPYAQFVAYGSIHNPRPVPFMDLASRRVEDKLDEVVDRGVSAAISEAGL